MANDGVFPPDATTDVGKVRLMIGDTEATGSPLIYAFFSDETIEVAFSLGGSISRTCAILIKQLALALTMAGQSIRADGFAINTLGKGKDLLEVAMAYTRQADAEDALASREADGSYAIVNTRLNELPRDTLGLRRSF
jgi:hypothetical protein